MCVSLLCVRAQTYDACAHSLTQCSGTLQCVGKGNTRAECLDPYWTCVWACVCVCVSQILDAYLLQSISGSALAERVLQCFRDSIHDSTSRVVKSLLLTQPQ